MNCFDTGLSFLWLFIFFSSLFDISFIFPRARGGWAYKTVRRMDSCFFHPMNHQWEKQGERLTAWRKFNSSQYLKLHKRILDFQFRAEVHGRWTGMHYGLSQGPVSLPGLAGIDQTSFAYALNFARLQNQTTTQQWHWRVKRSQKSANVATAPACLVNITLTFTAFFAYAGPPCAKRIWCTSSINLTKPRQKCWPTPGGVMSNFALHSQ